MYQTGPKTLIGFFFFSFLIKTFFKWIVKQCPKSITFLRVSRVLYKVIFFFKFHPSFKINGLRYCHFINLLTTLKKKKTRIQLLKLI